MEYEAKMKGLETEVKELVRTWILLEPGEPNEQESHPAQDAEESRL